MDIRDRQTLKKYAAETLEGSDYPHRRLSFIHIATTAVVLLAISAMDFLLQNQIAETGGLSGMGTRAVLSTIQSLLQSASSLALPFWQFGYIFAILGILQHKSVTPGNLLDGFRNFGPIIRFLLLKSLLFSALGIICFYPSMFLFMLTPWAEPVMALLEPYAESVTLTGQIILEEATFNAVSRAMLPMILIFLVLYLFLCAPIFYRLRLSEFALANDPRKGVFSALRKSAKLMRGNCLALFRMDLSFWWFYALEVILALICYGDAILPVLGIEFPFSANAAYFIFYVLNLTGQVALYTWKRNQVMGTYAHVFLGLQEAEEPPVTMEPQNQPWDYS